MQLLLWCLVQASAISIFSIQNTIGKVVFGGLDYIVIRSIPKAHGKNGVLFVS